MIPRDGHGERWFDQEAGPVVRPYAVTKGRTLSSSAASLGLIDVVAATGERPSEHFRPGPEHRRILGICRRPTPIVDLTSEIDLPLGVVRVLLGDLAQERPHEPPLRAGVRVDDQLDLGAERGCGDGLEDRVTVLFGDDAR